MRAYIVNSHNIGNRMTKSLKIPKV